MQEVKLMIGTHLPETLSKILLSLTWKADETIVADFSGNISSDSMSNFKSLGFAGFILASDKKLKNIQDPKTLGYFYLDGSWELPLNRARNLIIIGSKEELGAKRLSRLLTHGFKRVFIVGSLDNQPHSIYSIIFEYISRRLGVFLNFRKKQFLDALFQNRQSRDGYHQTAFIAHAKSLFLSCPVLKLQPIEKRIVLINNGLAPGGAERQFVNTANGLFARGFDLQIVVLKSGNDYFDFYRNKIDSRIPVFNLYEIAGSYSLSNESTVSKMLEEFISSFKNITPSLLWSDITSFVSVFLTLKPEVVHIWQDSTNIHAGIAASILGVRKIILSTRNMAPFRFAYYQDYMRPIYQRLVGQRNVLLSNNSNAGALDYAEWLGVDFNKIAVIHNGIEIQSVKSEKSNREFRAKHQIPENSCIVGGVFRFWPEKDPELWISVASLVAIALPDVHFLLVGDGPMRPEILHLASLKRLQDKIILTGYLEDPISAISCMDVFLLTSKFEGTPNVVIEAQMLGVPAVTTNAGGCRDIIEEDKTGFVLFDRSPEKLAAKTISLIQNREKRIQMSIHAKNRAGRIFGLQQMLNKTLDLYFDK